MHKANIMKRSRGKTMKKILILLIIGIFIASMLPGIFKDNITEDFTF
jgi:uncharacterized membrane protein YraQ (UPF0718 family)